MAQLSEDIFAFGKNLMSVDEALAVIAERVRPIAGVETLLLAQADGRVLAENLRAAVALPPFDNSAVDGYAARSVDLAVDAPTLLPLIGRIAAGEAAPEASMAGCAVRVLTGAPVPPEADMIFMQEDVTVAEGHRDGGPRRTCRRCSFAGAGRDGALHSLWVVVVSFTLENWLRRLAAQVGLLDGGDKGRPRRAWTFAPRPGRNQQATAAHPDQFRRLLLHPGPTAKTARHSNRRWMKIQGQVNAPTNSRIGCPRSFLGQASAAI